MKHFLGVKFTMLDVLVSLGLSSELVAKLEEEASTLLANFFGAKNVGMLNEGSMLKLFRRL